jgi:hypothetical protein
VKRNIKSKLRQLANNINAHEKSRQFQRGLNNFNKLWLKEMRVRINNEAD